VSTKRAALGLAVLAILALAACGETAATDSTPAVEPAGETTDAPKPTPAPEPAEANAVMPDVVGLDLQSAQDTIQESGVFFSRSEDATGQGRAQVMDRNWVVVRQNPAPGTPIGEGAAVLYVVKHGESSGEDASTAAPPTPIPVPTIAPAPPPSPTPAAPALTMEQENAVDSARSYLDFSGFSRQGLIAQLEYEQFSTEAATFAVDYVAADWNAEAAESARSYLEYSSFSRQGLIDQLLYEGFTPEQAEYGVSQNGY
jgi:hypothetical protein